MLQTDSLNHSGIEAVNAPDVLIDEQNAVVADTHKVQLKHPYQVLRLLPRDATPAQQDSAIQAVFHPELKNISTRPDTLHLPGHDKGKSIKDVSLPQYYKETFFSTNPMLHPEMDSGRYGVAGDPVPYNIRTDNVITSLLLGCSILVFLALSHSRRFILNQAKDFFYASSGNRMVSVAETSGEMRFQFFFVLLTCLLLSLVSFLYTNEKIADTFILSSPYILILIFLGCFSAYNLFKVVLYAVIDWVFFGKSESDRWMKSYMFILSVEGVALLPIVMLQSYFDLSAESSLLYALVVIILGKILAFYKCFTIFFIRKGGFLQIILYFCALELAPLFSLWGIMMLIVDCLKINY